MDINNWEKRVDFGSHLGEDWSRTRKMLLKLTPSVSCSEIFGTPRLSPGPNAWHPIRMDHLNDFDFADIVLYSQSGNNKQNKLDGLAVCFSAASPKLMSPRLNRRLFKRNALKALHSSWRWSWKVRHISVARLRLMVAPSSTHLSGSIHGSSHLLAIKPNQLVRSCGSSTCTWLFVSRQIPSKRQVFVNCCLFVMPIHIEIRDMEYAIRTSSYKTELRSQIAFEVL